VVLAASLDLLRGDGEQFRLAFACRSQISVDDAIRLGDRVFLLSPRPARILAEPPIRTPRNARGQAEIAAIRAGIEYLINDDRAKRNGI
jgi:ABC-type taurine transport system ATPase subunit